MNLLEMYYYVFYKYYKLFNALGPKRWTADMSAILVLMNLDACILFPFGFYYDIASHNRGTLAFFSFKILTPFLIILLVQWFAFWRNDNWKEYVKKFDQWPKNKNSKGTWIVVGITILLLANFIIALYLDPPPGAIITFITLKHQI